MAKGKNDAIHLPAKRRKEMQTQNGVVKISPEAYNTLVEIYNETTLSLKDIASILILKAAERVVYDEEDL